MSPAMQRFFANRTGKIGLGIVGFFVLLAILAPVLANDDPIVLVRNGEWFFPAIFDHDEFANVDWQVWLEKEPYDSALMPPVPFSPVRVRLDERAGQADAGGNSPCLGCHVLSGRNRRRSLSVSSIFPKRIWKPRWRDTLVLFSRE